MTKIKWLQFTILFSDAYTDEMNEKLNLSIKSEIDKCEVMIELNAITSFNAHAEPGTTTLRTYGGDWKVGMTYKECKKYILDETLDFNS